MFMFHRAFMKKISKALLLTALVLPGAGHLYLKHYLPGISIMGVFVYLLSIIILELYKRTEKISQQIMSGEIPPELGVIIEMVTTQSEQSSQQTSLVGYSLLFIWILSMLDIYRIDKKMK